MSADEPRDGHEAGHFEAQNPYLDEILFRWLGGDE